MELPDRARPLAETIAAQLEPGQELTGLVLVARTEQGGVPVPLIAYDVEAPVGVETAVVLDTLVLAARAASLAHTAREERSEGSEG
jgi:hypothetical protein